MSFKSTGNALKLALAAAVLLVAMTTVQASSARVTRVHDGHRNAGQLRFVGDETAKLSKCPSRMLCSLALSNRYPIADAMEVFQGQSSAGAFSLRYETLADAVVLYRAESGLTAGDFLETIPGAASSAGLKPLAMPVVSLANGLNLRAGKGFAIAIGGEIANAKVNAEPALGVNRSIFGDIYRHVEVEIAFLVDEIGLAALSFEATTVVWADDRRDGHSSYHGSYAHAVKSVLEGIEPLVERDCAVSLELWLNALVALVGFADLADYPDGVLSMESEQVTQLAVVVALESNLVSASVFKSLGCEPVASLVHALHRGQEFGFLIRRNEKFACRNEFHCHSRSISMCSVQTIGTCFIPDLKDVSPTQGTS